MNIKQQIGSRIREERKAKRLTRKVLAQLTDDLNISRINNYERGERTPGPEEIKQLAKALDISPAYLMCLTDDKHLNNNNKIPGLGAFLPIFNYQQASDIQLYVQTKAVPNCNQVSFIPVNPEFLMRLSKNAYAISMQDESMSPELRLNDIVLINPSAVPNPGDLIIVKLESSTETICRKFKQLSAEKDALQFDLLPFSDDWPIIHVNEKARVDILGTVIFLMRAIKTC